MNIEPIEKNNSTEFAQICMKWLNSNEPTLTVKDRNGNREKNVTYFRITLKGLDYIYAAPENCMCKNPDIVDIFMRYKGIYSPADKICVFNGSIEERQELGFYEKIAAQKKFNELFEKTFLPIFVAKYGNKVTGNEDLAYPWQIKTNYLQRGKEVSFLKLFYDRIKEMKFDNLIYENLHMTDSTKSYRILIDFIAKGQTEEAMREFIEKAITSCEKETPHVFTKMYGQFMNYLKSAKAVYSLSKAYLPTEDEKLTRSMCQAYQSFFKDKEPPKKVKITVRGTNENRSYPYKKDSIDIEGKTMTMKIPPYKLAAPWKAFEPNIYTISDLTAKDFPIKKDYNGRIEIPMSGIHTEDILKIEYGRKTIWEKPAKEAI